MNTENTNPEDNESQEPQPSPEETPASPTSPEQRPGDSQPTPPPEEKPTPPTPTPSPEQKPEAPKPVAPKPAPPPPKPVTPEQIQASKNVVNQPITRPAETPSDPAQMDRRSFIQWAALGWVAFAAAVGGYLSMFTRFLFPNVLFEPKQSFRAGFPDDYPIGEVSERWKEKHAVWIVRDSEKIYALSTVCTHLGCTPNWLSNEAKFKCPCHGSGFYKTGINFEGPAPRPLERFKIGLTDEGQILVDKTKKFQQEKGEWTDPESYLVA